MPECESTASQQRATPSQLLLRVLQLLQLLHLHNGRPHAAPALRGQGARAPLRAHAGDGQGPARRGYVVNVERSPARIFDDAEFEAVGATLVPEHSWPSAPADHVIVGLKELPEDSFPLKHTHVQFAHCYKQQGGWQQVLSRFPRGGGTLLDLEFLTDDSGRRVAAPRESSEAFSQALLPSLLTLMDRKTARVWQQAEELQAKAEEK